MCATLADSNGWFCLCAYVHVLRQEHLAHNPDKNTKPSLPSNQINSYFTVFFPLYFITHWRKYSPLWPNISHNESIHTFYSMFCHVMREKKSLKNRENRTIKRLFITRLIKNSFGWPNVWPSWQLQSRSVTGSGQGLALINGGKMLKVCKATH